MRRLRNWIVLGLIVAVTGTVWYRSRDVLMTEAEIRAAIPADLRYVPPTKEEARAEQRLWALERDVYTDPSIASPWVVGDFERAWPRFWHAAENSDWVIPRVEELAKRDTPAAELDLNTAERYERAPWNLFRVLALRCDLKIARYPKADIRRDTLALAHALRLVTLRRGSHGDQRFPAYTALMALNRALGVKTLDRATLEALYRILPTDTEVLAVQQDQIRYDLEEDVASRLMPKRVVALLRPRLDSKDDFRQYIVGRLDVRATLRTQVDFARGSMAMMATDKKDLRVSQAIRQRQDIIGTLPWKKPGESETGHRLRALGYRLRMLAHPNPRSVLVTLGRPPDEIERDERAWLALTRARLQVMLKEKGALPTDPYSGKPVRYNAKRGIVWSIGAGRTDEGGTMSKFWIGKPDMVVRTR